MDFDKYINSLNEITNQENKAELENFYTLHSSLLQFFKAIDKSIQEVLSKSAISLLVVTELKEVLSILTKLKAEINKLKTDVLSISCETGINESVAYIKNEMTISEINEVSQHFFDLLKENNKHILIEKKEQELEQSLLEGKVSKANERMKIANQTNKVEVLLYLSKDRSYKVQECVFNNKNTPEDVRNKLRKEISAKQKQAKENYDKLFSGSNNNNWCFVATACYGNYNAPEVLVLRKYRDENLLTNLFGKLFVKFYYFVSPPLARQIEKSEKIKKLIRKRFLKPIVNKIIGIGV
jgi:uncharacterized small protein (DUF1192 family)